MRGPLAHIVGYAEMLLEGFGGELSEDQRDFLLSMMAQGEEVMALAQTLIEFSAVESGHLECARAPVSGDTLLNTMFQYGQRLGGKQDVDVVLDKPRESLPHLLGDADKIRSALYHLVQNAVRFTPAGGFVQIGAAVESTRNEGRWLCFWVEDSGVGIPAEHLESIFLPFVSLQPTGERHATGVGLTVARAYVQAHNGQIRVSSSPGAGSRFTVRLPLE
jgi:signal transduction histidine kinase